MKRLSLVLICAIICFNLEAVRGSSKKKKVAKIAAMQIQAKARRSVVTRQETVEADDLISSTAIAMDLDDVMSIKQKPGALDFIALSRAVVWHPWILGAFTKIGELQKEGSVVGSTVNGTSNVVQTMLQKLKERGYGDLSHYQDEIVFGATKPKPINQMVDAVRQLKAKGHIVIAATNQDWKQHVAYRKRMRSHGVDLNLLFDAVVTTGLGADTQERQHGFHCPTVNENIYAVSAANVKKPDAAYYQQVQAVADYIGETRKVTIKRIVFTDDKEENIDGAARYGFKAIHFDLPAGSARKSSPEELQTAVNQWHTQLHNLSVDTK